MPALALAVGEATALEVFGEGLLVGELPHAALKTIATMAVKGRLRRRIPAPNCKRSDKLRNLKATQTRFAPLGADISSDEAIWSVWP